MTVEERIRASFARQPFMQTLGARMARVGEGEADIELGYDERLTQQHGFLHAGAVASVVDSACGYAALSLMDEDSAVLTVEFKLNLLAPATGAESFLATGRVLKPGRTIFVCVGELLDGDRRLAHATATIMAVRGRGLSD